MKPKIDGRNDQYLTHLASREWSSYNNATPILSAANKPDYSGMSSGTCSKYGLPSFITSIYILQLGHGNYVAANPHVALNDNCIHFVLCRRFT